MTFIYEFDPYFLEIHRMSENELPFESYRLTDIQTDRQTDVLEITYHAASPVVNNVIYFSVMN